MKVCQGVCKLLTPNRDFSVAEHESIAKKTFGNQLRVSRSKSITKSNGLLTNDLSVSLKYFLFIENIRKLFLFMKRILTPNGTFTI